MAQRIVKIRTRYRSHPVTGAGKIGARCCAYNRRLTIPYPYELGEEARHTLAAEKLAKRIASSLGATVGSSLDRERLDGGGWLFHFAIVWQ